jgi:hypothetical protein
MFIITALLTALIGEVTTHERSAIALAVGGGGERAEGLVSLAAQERTTRALHASALGA